MKYILLTFASRTSLLNFTKFLKLNGISFSIINTPRALSISCGLSVKVGYIHYKKINNLSKNSNLGIKSVFIVENFSKQENFQKIF